MHQNVLLFHIIRNVDESAGARKTIPWIPNRRFRRLATDDLRLSAQTFTEIRDRLLQKSADFRK